MAKYIVKDMIGYEELKSERDRINLDISMHPNMNSENLEILVEEISSGLSEFRANNPELFMTEA